MQLNRVIENTVRIGLFWFSQDYSTIIRSEGEREISNADLLKPERIDPIGLHADYDMPRNTPRGRLYYDNRLFQIWVGEDCEITDEKIIETVKKYFDLQKISINKFKVKRHYHWNTKTN